MLQSRISSDNGTRKVNTPKTSPAFGFDLNRTIASTNGCGNSEGEPSTIPTVALTYDRLGRQLSGVVDGVSASSYTYSTIGQLLTETQNVNGGEPFVIDRYYDTFGRPTGYDMESGGGILPPSSVTYTYDTYGRFASVSSDNIVWDYTYLPGTRLVSSYTSSLGNSFTRTYEQNRDLIASVINSYDTGSADIPVRIFNYTNDAIGRRTQRNTDTFSYNTRNEVIAADIYEPINLTPNIFSYSYDAIGNRISSEENNNTRSYAANELNQYTAIATTPENLATKTSNLIYDLDGNLLYDGTFTYAYDGENRLTTVSALEPNTSNLTPLAHYSYDHRSRRIYKETPEESIHFIYDDWNLINESIYTATNNWQLTSSISYTWGLDLSGTLQGAGGVGGLLVVSNENGTFAPCYDANGNITDYLALAISNQQSTISNQQSAISDGSLVASFDYDPFGNTIAETSCINNEQSNISFRFRLSTKYHEQFPRNLNPTTNPISLYYYGYRFYSPNIGRWLNRDPIGDLGGLNLYCIAKNNLNNMIDKLGLTDAGENGDLLGEGSIINAPPISVAKYCCGNPIKIYDNATKCCCNKTKGQLAPSENFTNFDDVIVDRDKVFSGVINWAYTSSIFKDANGRYFGHVWISWPGGSADSNGDSMFSLDGQGSQTVASPAFASKMKFENSQGTTSSTLDLSPCEYNFNKLWNCLSRTAASMTGTNGGMCHEFTKLILNKCLESSKGCTAN